MTCPLLWPAVHLPFDSAFSRVVTVPTPMRFFLSLLADVIFLLGLAAIVVGIALAGHGPLAVCVAGAEMTVAGILLRSSLEPREEEGDGL